MKRKPIYEGAEWSFELLEQYDKELARIAKSFELDTYPNQVEVITSEQMMDAYASIGMPLNYNHWSFGKRFLTTQKNYRYGGMGLAYEIVINSNPCIAYLMEENTMTMQALVIAHACYGHNSFFKNNYLFTSWTSADAIIDYLVFAKKYIAQCEERYGIDAVEDLLDSCHALMNYGVDRYKHPSPLSLREEQHRQKSRAEYLQSQVNQLWKTLPESGKNKNKGRAQELFPKEPEENLLYFFEKHAPLLEPWQREILRIVRKLAQYFYPQRQTQVMNEGWATFWHYTLINKMYDEGLVNDGFMLEFLQAHTSVLNQPSFDSPYFSGINPYALGYAIYMDIKRMCEEPTDEDRQWFPEIAGADWLPTLDFAMRNFKDESFVAQYLSPKVMRDMQLFTLRDNEENNYLEIAAIHNDNGYQKVRQALSDQYNLSYAEPDIQVYNVEMKGSRSITLRHYQNAKRPLGTNTEEMLKHVYRLWGFPVFLECIGHDGEILKTYRCPEEKPEAEGVDA